MRIGLISDTHGLMRTEAVEALRGSDLIVHAGDIGRPEVLQELNRLAPVAAVRGNMDSGDWARRLPPVRTVDAGGVPLLVVHELARADPALWISGVRVVVSGHSHRPSIADKGGVLFLNPGSAGPRRFRLPVTVMSLEIRGDELEPRLLVLDA